jgi:hypothetical protein
MDLYIETCGLWDDFHHNLIAEIAGKLADAIPARYVVRTGQRTYLAVIDAIDNISYPVPAHVRAATQPGRRRPSKKGGTTPAEPVTPQEPHVLCAFIEEEHREAFVEIYETDPEMKLVTTIEVLSPSNKRPGTEGWDLYRRKRQSILLDDVNLVEIDLLRSGRRMPMLDPWPNSPYTLMVARARNPQLCRVWEGHFQRPLPAITVPLAKPDPGIPLELQPLIATIYRRFHYERSINYAASLDPPLDPAEAASCRKLLDKRPRR